jgi:uncharacterized membrane protein YedE/YeeE
LLKENMMLQLIMALIAGLVFGLGLIVSGMTDPSKVIGFLDLFGLWNPSLAFVMGGAVAVGLIAFPFAAKRATALLGGPIRLPTASQIDRRLVLGGLAFGAGWGLAGYCPGPALASLLTVGAASGKAWLFVAAMLVGMGLFEILERRSGAAKK